MATIKDIAKLANVSIGTVDRVIHNRGYVSPDTKKRVKQAIKTLNYSPNVYARQLKLAKKYEIGILMPELHQDANYWEQSAIGMLEAGKELESQNIKLKFFHFDRYSEASFNEKCSQILKEDLDGLLIAPVLINLTKEFLSRIPRKTPYIFFDSDLPDTKRITFIGQDAYQSGILAGKLMRILIDDSGDIAIIRVMPEDYHISQRTLGFQSYFQDNNIKNNIQVYEWAESPDLSSINALLNTIIDNKNFKGIFVTNALTFLVASYMELNNNQNKIRIIGYDLIKENVAFLNKSVIDFLICQSPIAQGYQGIQLLYRKVVLNQNIDDKIMMPIDIVTKENIEFYKYASRKNM
ncbi:MAG: LacI family DNA-binding transcriptional regulator [Ignavibacteria bacterium]